MTPVMIRNTFLLFFPNIYNTCTTKRHFQYNASTETKQITASDLLNSIPARIRGDYGAGSCICLEYVPNKS